MHMAPTDRVERWSEFRKDAPDLYSLNEFQEANMKQGMAHADGAKRWRLRDTTTLMTARLSAPVPDLGRKRRGLSLLRSERTLLRTLNRVTETVLARVAEELEELRMLCESVLDMAGVGHERLDCAAIQPEVARLLQPWQRDAQGLRRRVADARAGPERAGADDGAGSRGSSVRTRSAAEGEREWEARVMSLAAGAAENLSGDALQPARPQGQRAVRAVGGAARHAAHAGHAGRRSRPGGRTLDAPAEAQLRLHPAQQPVRRGRPGEASAAPGPRRHDARHHLPHPAHAGAHWCCGAGPGRSMASTFSVVTQAGRRVGLEFMPEPIIGPAALPAMPAAGP